MIEERIRRIMVLSSTLHEKPEITISGPFTTDAQICWCEAHPLRFQVDVADVAEKYGTGATIEEALADLEEHIRGLVQDQTKLFQGALVESSR